MDDIASQSWFGWSLGLIFGLPVLLVVLSEVHLRLERRRSPLAGPVNRLRLLLLPGVGLLVLLTQAAEVDGENNGVQIVATVVGVLAVSIALGGLNAVLFVGASHGTWRERLPSIFVDLARLILVVTGAAIVASLVWGLDVGGWFATLGVASIVIGLALQNAIGSVVSGLLLLFEQPFKLGDALEVDGTTGRVVEMNWRATHIDTGSGILVVPNATLADSSFANFSRPTPAHDHDVAVTMSAGDAPHRVFATLTSVAETLPMLRTGGKPDVRATGAGAYVVTLPLTTAAEIAEAESTFLTWLWYASRRDDLHLAGAALADSSTELAREALLALATVLDLGPDEIAALADDCEVEQFAPGELILAEGRLPGRYMFVHSGVVGLSASLPDGARIDVTRLDRGEVVGSSALLREPSSMSATALTLVEILQVPLEIVDRVVSSKPSVARRLSGVVDGRRQLRRDALAAAGVSQEIHRG